MSWIQFNVYNPTMKFNNPDSKTLVDSMLHKLMGQSWSARRVQTVVKKWSEAFALGKRARAVTAGDLT